jgi:hypothetical protein
MKKGEPPTLLPLIINKKTTQNTNAKSQNTAWLFTSLGKAESRKMQ